MVGVELIAPFGDAEAPPLLAVSDASELPVSAVCTGL